MKQTADFQKGVGLCAEETKTFLRHHIFDRCKTTALFEKIEQRLDNISRERNIQTNYQIPHRQITFHRTNPNQMEEPTAGVLLDLSMKQNRQRDQVDHNSTTTTSIQSLCSTLNKREILDKIRKKILDKRRLMDTNQSMEIIRNEMMWRPWRY